MKNTTKVQTINSRDYNIQQFIDEWNVNKLTGNGLIKYLIEIGISKRHLMASKVDIDIKIWKMVEGFLKDESIYLYGNIGVGKSYLASTLIREKVIQNKANQINGKLYIPETPKFINLTELLMKIKNVYKESSELSEEEIINYYANINCLVIDDIGVEKTTEWVLQTLYLIIDKRNRSIKQTLFTSNLTLKELKDKVGERIPSRIAELCGFKNIIALKGKDRRLDI